MHTKAFYDLQHAKSYLQASIVRYLEKPIYITNIGISEQKKEFLLTYHDLKDIYSGNNPKIGNFPDDTLDPNPVPLGMVNIEGSTVFYVERMPIRQWKIGLTHSNTNSHCIVEGYGARDHQKIIYSSNMTDTILNRYPNFQKILGMVNPTGAFSRRFAISDKKLLYRTRGRVGSIVNDKPKLKDKYFFLKEVLMEDLNG